MIDLSICIACWKEWKYLKPLPLDLKQKNIEVIIAIDEIPRNQPSEIKFLHITHSSRPEVRNLLLENASGKSILFLDAASEFKIGDIDKMLILAKQYPIIQFSIMPKGDSSHFFIELQKRTHRSRFSISHNSIWKPSGFSNINTAGFLICRDIINNLGGFNPRYKRFEDREVIFRLLKQENIKIFCDEDIIIKKTYDRKNYVALLYSMILDHIYHAMAIREHFPNFYRNYLTKLNYVNILYLFKIKKMNFINIKISSFLFLITLLKALINLFLFLLDIFNFKKREEVPYNEILAFRSNGETLAIGPLSTQLKIPKREEK